MAADTDIFFTSAKFSIVDSALMIVTDGQVVYEWGNTTNNFQAHSMRKSLISALYGVAVDRGEIDTSLTLRELGIDDKTPLTEAEKEATISDLLKARSGVYIPAAGEAASMKASRPRRGSHAPGTFWYYNNWDFNALGTIFDQETGEENIYSAFKRRIADPLFLALFDVPVPYRSGGRIHFLRFLRRQVRHNQAIDAGFSRVGREPVPVLRRLRQQHQQPPRRRQVPQGQPARDGGGRARRRLYHRVQTGDRHPLFRTGLGQALPGCRFP